MEIGDLFPHWLRFGRDENGFQTVLEPCDSGPYITTAHAFAVAKQLVENKERDSIILRKRCLHDVVNLLVASARDTRPSDDPREVLRCLAMAVNEQGIDDFGMGECSCKRADCPYKV